MELPIPISRTERPNKQTREEEQTRQAGDNAAIASAVEDVYEEHR